jgi:hypothetical protein
MIYGYKNRVISEEGLLELQEITFVESAEDLRVIAAFLLRKAKQMEEGTFRLSHEHLSSEVRGWNIENGKTDIIVSPPDVRR